MDIVFTQVNKPLTFTMQASDDEGDLLLFENAVLGRVEVNKNNDDIDQDGINDLARTIAGRAIDVDHEPRKNAGFFTKGEANENGELVVAGVIWQDRYPTEAEKVKNGTMHFSLEASAKSAACSVCGSEFDDRTAYCEHLKNRRVSGAVRKLRQLRAKGGGLTSRPAGTGTRFDQSRIYVVASHQEDEKDENAIDLKPDITAGNTDESDLQGVHTMKCPKCGEEIDMKEPDGDEAKASLQAQLASVQTEFDKYKVEAEAKQKEEWDARMALKAIIEDENNKLIIATSRQNELLASLRRNQLKPHYTDEDWNENKDEVLAMSDKQFHILAASFAKAQPQKAGLVMPEIEPVGDKPKLVLHK